MVIGVKPFHESTLNPRQDQVTSQVRIYLNFSPLFTRAFRRKRPRYKFGFVFYWDTCGSPVIKCLCFIILFRITRFLLIKLFCQSFCISTVFGLRSPGALWRKRSKYLQTHIQVVLFAANPH